jgi:pyrroline-5-carboxylate reductase
MPNLDLAFLGGGNMGRALISGLLRSGTRPEHIRVGESSAAARETLARELAVAATGDNSAALAGAAVVVLAVKPQDAAAVLEPLGPQLRRERSLLLSVVAGVPCSQLAAWCGGGVPVVRAMPNRPAQLGAGATGLYAPAQVGAAQRAAAERIARAVGEVVWVPREEDLDVLTALSGSGPAYFLLLAQLMAESAAELGLAPDLARRLAVATLYGTGLLAQSGDRDLERLRAEITSTGGTTQAALEAFAAADFKGAVARALAAATRRSRELATEQALDS